MAFENILFEKDGSIATVTINRPKALNALNADTLKELDQVFTELAADDTVSAVILTGAGEKAFVAGADISFMKDLTAVEARAFAQLGQAAFNKIENLPQPVIAAINGFALGGGCELASACDIRLASESAKFGQPEVNLGVPPGFAGTQRLPRLVGKGRAKELLYTGDMIDAAEAYRIGLVNKVFATAEELQEAAKKMAKKIAGKGQIAVRVTKSAVNQGMEMDSARGMAYEAEVFGLVFSTEDQKEGMAAFLEKRKAEFKGK
ncbi:short-chain-enoyl-CoA hydratase [Dethiobacter alkaliphilus]|uniref:Enoyl-CoA hydratase/isomerase n=1 Tax=Dethiobacter alkaliphilus AHT 1 TaxID=555088 RepID=C0GKR8_DETAL|nr:short-chain-enoyl-CoA hydratase [Dethiobacter alkaliphilus]EEG76090.1 Enoyl-CoA hydratase/isomerase [Dethiobacter alkaliphilus AHT 1]MCW3489768.1 short-chain-enoyl-CoA hydratase [Dethiobacter alkaliphilus]